MKRIVLENNTFTNNRGEYFSVLEYLGSNRYLIKFESNGYICIARGDRIREGRPENPFTPIFKGVGYMGSGKYNSGGVGREAYLRWSAIWRRIQEPDLFPSYADCSLDPDWHNFQNFAEWYYNTPYNRKDWQIDKDILVPGNRVYSADTCVMVPDEINQFFTSKVGIKAPYRGVTKDRHGKFVANLRNEFGKHRLGYFENPEDAYQCYCEAKDIEASRLAQKWKSEIDPRLYDRLVSFNFKEDFDKLMGKYYGK